MAAYIDNEKARRKLRWRQRQQQERNDGVIFKASALEIPRSLTSAFLFYPTSSLSLCQCTCLSLSFCWCLPYLYRSFARALKHFCLSFFENTHIALPTAAVPISVLTRDSRPVDAPSHSSLALWLYYNRHQNPSSEFDSFTT